ncbi:cytochrome P450 [Catenulispora pinisilvae]|uniref:cytochrome P450 n=1 Tax=Catenulispora pinisilvae TaxID=2705253 RepID=UPI0018926B66|nr:cytochrome P450 [Catenulispora pinisilvae]
MSETAWSWSVAGVLVAAVLASLPYWLPGIVVALRVRIFALVNGTEGIPVPGNLVGTEDFKRVYADPAANGRSRGAALSDLFWYWLAPGPQVHQEHLEPGPRYDDVARTTRRTIARLRKDDWEELVARCAAREFDRVDGSGAGSGSGYSSASARARIVRLRDAMMPLWASVYYEVVFAEPCPPEARDLIVANANDVVSALKCTRLRHMGRRERLTRYLQAKIAAGAVPYGLPAALTEQEQAFYLQGTYFNTAVVQMSEGMAHLLLAIAARPELQRQLRDDPEKQQAELLDRVIDETLRVYPLFGVAHRITSAQIALGETAIPAGSVLLFNYAEYHHAGVPDAAEFDPDRWLREHLEQVNNIPFGISANRPCPARGIAPLTMRVAAAEVLRRYALSTSVGHTRSLPNRGPCLLTPLTPDQPEPPRPAARLAWLRVRDRWEDVWRSLVQLVLGTYMVWDARRLRLCRNYFAAQEAEQ